MTRLQWLYLLAAMVMLFALGSAAALFREMGELETRITGLETGKTETASQPEPVYYDIPLSHFLQDYTMEVCEAYGLPAEMAYGVMYVESRFQPDADSGQAHGLMQISNVVAEAYGVDATDTKENIKLGCWLLATYSHQYEDMHKALMAYNQGQGGAAESWVRGIMQTDYSRAVLSAAERFNKEEQQCG